MNTAKKKDEVQSVHVVACATGSLCLPLLQPVVADAAGACWPSPLVQRIRCTHEAHSLTIVVQIQTGAPDPAPTGVLVSKSRPTDVSCRKARCSRRRVQISPPSSAATARRHMGKRSGEACRNASRSGDDCRGMCFSVGSWIGDTFLCSA